MKTFTYNQSFLSNAQKRLKFSFISKFCNKDINLFIRTNDIISYNPLLRGCHEPAIESLIRLLSVEHGDFLLDIGANIGLTSVLTGDNFRRVDCVEPNPLVANILKTNLAINLRSESYQVHTVGLGDKNDKGTLLIPPHNFGGAFILKGNSYHRDLLASKDGFASFDKKNYLIQPIELVNSAEWLRVIFDAYGNADLINGVVKIDVEGFEPTIIESILAVLPEQFRVAIIFENWAPDLDETKHKSERHSLSFYALYKSPSPKAGRTGEIFYLLSGLIHGFNTRLANLSEIKGSPHDVVLFLEPKINVVL